MKNQKKFLSRFVILAFICQVAFIGISITTGAKASAITAAPASSSLKIGLKITKMKGLLNDGVYYYPKVEGINNPKFDKIKIAFNKRIKKDILALKNDETSSLNGTYTIQYLNSNLIAIRFVGDSFTPNTAHPNKWDIVFHYDLNTGNLYKLEDLFQNKTDYIKQIKAIAKKNDKAFKAKTSNLFQDWNYENFDSAWDGEETYFAVKSQNIFNIYFFSNYATGYASGYDLPFSSLKSILDTKGSFYKAITSSKPSAVNKLNYTKPIKITFQ